MRTSDREFEAALSPDGRWMAYVSTETGRQEVFVRPFPEVEAGKWQVSTAGGTSPVWAHSGQELFFVNGDREVMSQAVLPGVDWQRFLGQFPAALGAFSQCAEP